ncbi:MAG TPA: tRNA (adenosine(37)-N6)-threonylcarbamoyltransferase complex ATPase subunit type 1 TsaE [Sediminispirochaeta sp.]|nr:tRNA (adenosine(37)-N6)-threonylcarbamoyltransferase complex ATPase subunit type 1 TsaE [Sediminispirochaeta sp.]
MGKTRKLTSHSPEETMEIGERIGSQLLPNSIIALHGSLGSGKTCLAKGIARGLDIEEDIISPSFTLISEYEGRLPLFHMDLYRIEGTEEFEMLGAEEMFYADGVSLIEWAEKIEELLPKDHVRIEISIRSDGSRDISLSGSEIGFEL